MSADDRTDPFAPPPLPTEVYCLHCQQTYDSWQIEWRERAGGPSADRYGRGEGDWCCPTPGCDGLGFCFDIWPTDPEWRDEDGEPIGFAIDEGDEENWAESDEIDEGEDDYYWVPLDLPPMTPEERDAFDRAWETMTGDTDGAPLDAPTPDLHHAGDDVNEDDVPF